MKHEFALFTLIVDAFTSGQVYELTEKALTHRITHVLRLKPGDTLILFSKTQHAVCSIETVSKKTVHVMCRQLENNQRLYPAVHWLIPVLEREAFEASWYALAAMGATSITPVITEKSRKKWGAQKDYERAERIIIAAAEQAKQFAMPEVRPVQSLADALKQVDGTALFFDVAGTRAFEVVTEINRHQPELVTCCIGPEGDLTPEEKAIVLNHGFTACQLTPTVLRARDAVAVGMGIIRSCIRQDA